MPVNMTRGLSPVLSAGLGAEVWLDEREVWLDGETAKGVQIGVKYCRRVVGGVTGEEIRTL